ncbi:hypothetical protein [Paractinoplanes lichenicola]|uniref:Uncharacterized protein n=1 Tax=Paractinoplanes lichenicola TaxID=2802976 RepID=A0ABS1VUI4_9ACTN|nr:hypothetical protein [Actinoplanes lichenicola]MBL7258143.1 hypothetical protein [Actinoplanes lichenicola]
MRRALIVAGVVVMAYGLIGVLGDPGVLVFLIAVLVLHDAVFLPLVLAAGALIGRRPVVRASAVIGLSASVVGLPLVVTGDSSYGWGLLLILTALAVVAVPGRKGIERWRARSGRARRG